MTDGKKAVADYLRNIADKIEDGYIYECNLEENRDSDSLYSDGPCSPVIRIPIGPKTLKLTWSEGPKKKLKEPGKTVKKQPINDLDTALSMVKDVVSNTEDIEAVKRRTLIMIDMIRERYCGC